jgi:hypothetical protein
MLGNGGFGEIVGGHELKLVALPGRCAARSEAE